MSPSLTDGHAPPFCALCGCAAERPDASYCSTCSPAMRWSAVAAPHLIVAFEAGVRAGSARAATLTGPATLAFLLAFACSWLPIWQTPGGLELAHWNLWQPRILPDQGWRVAGAVLCLVTAVLLLARRTRVGPRLPLGAGCVAVVGGGSALAAVLVGDFGETLGFDAYGSFDSAFAPAFGQFLMLGLIGVGAACGLIELARLQAQTAPAAPVPS